MFVFWISILLLQIHVEVIFSKYSLLLLIVYDCLFVGYTLWVAQQLPDSPGPILLFRGDFTTRPVFTSEGEEAYHCVRK
jgi:hypothetical protein